VLSILRRTKLKMSKQMTTAPPTRKHYPKKKRLMYEELQRIPTEYNVIALSKMSKVRAAQLMMIRKKFRNQVQIKIIKNKVAIRAFEKVKDVAGIENLSNRLEGQCALIFTNINPFKLNLIFAQNKVFLPAKGGDIAPKEIFVPAGNTGITPGPVLSEFKVANVATKIDQGTIWVSKDTLVAKRGDAISMPLASLLSKLNVKPIEAGISVNFAIAEGLQFQEQDLKLNLEEYKEVLARSFAQALALATEVGYMTPETVTPLLVKAHQQAISLAAEAGYVTPETAGLVLPRAEAQAQALANRVKEKGYSPQ
jgi:large subunit ribosomal protein L10